MLLIRQIGQCAGLFGVESHRLFQQQVQVVFQHVPGNGIMCLMGHSDDSPLEVRVVV